MKKFDKLEEIKNSLLLNDGDLIKTAEHLCMKYQTLYYHVKRNNLKFYNQKKVDVSVEELWIFYKKLNSLKKVGSKFDCTADYVADTLRKNGYEINKPLNRFKSNENLFKEETEKSFYWAGFIAADGCVKIKQKRYHQLQIGLAICDKNHVEKFKNDIEFEGNIFDFIVKKQKEYHNDSFKSELTISSKIIFDDLARFNIVPRKSLIYTFPMWLIDHPLVHHFMRGYFDGDGSFYKTLGKNKKAEQECFSLRGTSEFLTVFRSILEKYCDLKIREKPIRINSNIGILEYGGNGILLQLRDFLAKNMTIYLDRKWNKYIEEKQLKNQENIKSIEENT